MQQDHTAECRHQPCVAPSATLLCFWPSRWQGEPYTLNFTQSAQLTYSSFLCPGSDGWSQGKQIPDNLCHRFLCRLSSNEVHADINLNTPGKTLSLIPRIASDGLGTKLMQPCFQTTACTTNRSRDGQEPGSKPRQLR